VWEAAVLPQPFEREPLRPVRVPEWVRGTIGAGYTLSAMSGEQRQVAVDHGVTLSEFGFVDPFYAYYDSQLLKRRSPHVPPERLQHDYEEYQRLGVRILGVYPPCLQGEVYELHPDWRRIATNTTEIPQVDMEKYPHGGMLCLLGPYGDFFIEVLAEILTLYPAVDAFSFDGLHYGGVCYCQHCRQAYREEFQSEIPNADMNLPEFRRYQHWADRRMEALIQRMQQRLKGIKPEVALVTWTTNAGRFGHFLTIPRNMPARMNLLLDAPDQEFWLDESNRGNSIVPAIANAYIWATTNHRVAFSEPYLMSHGNPYGKDSFPQPEILRRMLLAATHGAVPSIAVLQPQELQSAVLECMREVQARQTWLTHKQPERWAALLVSDNTRNFYGRSSGEVESRYLSNVFGMFRMAMEEHLPVTLINDWNLTEADLSGYSVLILPNAACLDDSQAAAIRKFVAAGGGLVATVDTSLFNEFGDARDDFALADLFGAHFRGAASSSPVSRELDLNFAQSIPADYWLKRQQVFDYWQGEGSFLDTDKLKTYVGRSRVTFKGQAVAVAEEEGTEVLARMAAKEPQGAAELPAVLSRQHGQGKVIYSAAGFDSAYYLYSYPYQRILLRQAVLEASPVPPPVSVTAPMCVQMNLFRQHRDGERLVMHLFNNVNTTAGHAFPNDDVPLREETLPIHDIRVRFDAAYPVQRVHLEPGGMELEVTREATGWSVTVPKLEVHAMVVAELEVAH
jgi:hypothetical protein